MDTTIEKEVTVGKGNRNPRVTDIIHDNKKSSMQKVTGYGSTGDREKSIFDVGTDVLDVAMRAFTVLVQIQKEQARGGFLSMPVASWETACLSRGLTREQFGKAKAYCDALHVYRKENGGLVLEDNRESVAVISVKDSYRVSPRFVR